MNRYQTYLNNGFDDETIQNHLRPKYKEAGFTDEQIDAYFKQNQLKPVYKSNVAKGTAQGVTQGATFGQAPHLAGVTNEAMNLPKKLYSAKDLKDFGRIYKDLGKDYIKGREDFKKEYNTFAEEHPIISLGSEIAGGLSTGKGLTSLLKSTKILRPITKSNILQPAAEGGIYGFSYGASNTEGKGFDPVNAAIGTAAGSVGGAALGSLTKGLQKLFLSKNTGRVGDYIRPEGVQEHSMQHIINDPEVAKEVAKGGIGKRASEFTSAAREGFDNTKKAIDSEIKKAYSGISDDTMINLNKVNDTVKQMEDEIAKYEKLAGKDPEAQKAIAKAQEKINIIKDEVRENFEKDLIDNAYKDVKANPLKGDRIGKDEILAEIIPDNLNTYIINRGAAIKDKAGNIIVQGKELEKLTGTNGNFGFSKMIFKHGLTSEEIGRLPRILREYNPSSVRPDGNINWRVPLDNEHNMIISFVEKGKNKLKEITVHKERVSNNKKYDMSQKKNYIPGELLGRSIPDTAQTAGKPSAESVVLDNIIGNKFENVNKKIDFGKLKYHIDDLNNIIDSFYKDLPTGGRKLLRPQKEVEMFSNIKDILRNARDNHSPELKKATNFYSDMQRLKEEVAKINPHGLEGEDKIGKSAARLNKDLSGDTFKVAESNIRKILGKYPQLEGVDKFLTDLKKLQVASNIKSDENYATSFAIKKIIEHFLKGGNRDQRMQAFARAVRDGKVSQDNLNKEFTKVRNIPVFTDIINYYLAANKVPDINNLSKVINSIGKTTPFLRRFVLPRATIKEIFRQYYDNNGGK